jgi:hypothetical protein
VSETALSKAIRDALKRVRHVKVLRLNSGLVRAKGGYVHLCENGTPDLMVMLPHKRVCWLEAKTRDGVVEDEQVEWHAQALALGHVVHVVRDVQHAVDVVIRERDAT